METTTKPIPEGFHTVTPHLVVNGASDAIAFYKKAFGATEIMRLPMPDGSGKLMHAQIRIGTSFVMLMDDMQGCATGPAAGSNASMVIHLFVPDVDATIAQAAKAGAEVTMPAADMFWGDRYGQIVDPFGHKWSVATHMRDLTPEQIAKGGAEMMAAHAAQKG